MGRDPIQEQGGLNLYGLVTNNPINRWDFLGLQQAEGRTWEVEEVDSEGIRWLVYYKDEYDGAIGGYEPKEQTRVQVNNLMTPFEVKENKEEPAILPVPIYDQLVAIAPAMDLAATIAQTIAENADVTSIVRNGVKKGITELGAKYLRKTTTKKSAPEKTATDIHKRVERDLGPDARRELHDMKDGGERTFQDLKDQARALYEAAGKPVPWFLR